MVSDEGPIDVDEPLTITYANADNTSLFFEQYGFLLDGEIRRLRNSEIARRLVLGGKLNLVVQIVTVASLTTATAGTRIIIVTTLHTHLPTTLRIRRHLEAFSTTFSLPSSFSSSLLTHSPYFLCSSSTRKFSPVPRRCHP